jgi:hypothetical protein
MCNWLEDAINFLFPEPVQQDMDGDIVTDIPAKPVDSDAYMETLDILPDIPEHLRRLPAVEEAERVIRNRQRGTPLTVKNIKDALRRSSR